MWAGNKLRRCGAKEVNKLMLIMIANGPKNRNRDDNIHKSGFTMLIES